MKTAAELQADAWEAIVKGLGLADALRYRILFVPGHGDYAREREVLFQSMTLDDWIAAVGRGGAEGPGGPGGPGAEPAKR